MIKIAHFSDHHIRNFERHEEYKKSQEVFYASLKISKPDFIIFTGDLVHNKNRISPELVKMCSEFLKNLSNIAPLIMILGNHDQNLSNQSRLDAITPILNAMNNENIFCYKKSGIYPLTRFIDLVVFSCFESDLNWPTKEQIDNNKINIGLYHGTLQGAKFQNGMIVKAEDCPYNAKKFLDIVDYLMLGDIHKLQSIGSVVYEYIEVDEENIQQYLDNGWKFC